MDVGSIMTANPECCRPDTSLREVAQLMVAGVCGEIPVCDAAGKPVGVVTDRDIVCRVVAKGRNPAELAAGDCMSRPVVTAIREMAIEDCARLMEQYQVRRIPVVDDQGKCCGVVAQADLARKAPQATTIEVVERVSSPSPDSSAGGMR